MGQEIVYCGRCQRRIVGADFDNGQAFQIGNNQVCSTCAAGLLPTLELKDRERLLKDMFKSTRDRRSTSTASLPAIRSAPAADRNMSGRKSTASIPILKTPPPFPARPAATRRSPVPRFLVAAFVGGGFILLVFWMLSGSGASESGPGNQAQASRRPATPRPPENPSLGRTPVAPDPREAAAREAVRTAELFQTRNPQDVDGIQRQWAAASKAAERTTAAGEVLIASDAARRRCREITDREIAALEEQAKRRLEEEDYKGASDVYKSALDRHSHPDWAFALEKRAGEAFQAASGKLPALKEEAVRYARKKDSSGLRLLRERVVKWGFPDLISDLDRSIATAATEPTADPGPPWTQLLTGRWIQELVKANCGWHLEDGALVSGGENVRSARTWEDYSSGEFRVRFEVSGTTYLFFNACQSDDGQYEVVLHRVWLEALAPGEHVLHISVRQGKAEAVLDGSPFPVIVAKKPRSGAFQFSPGRGRLRITSLEYRP